MANICLGFSSNTNVAKGTLGLVTSNLYMPYAGVVAGKGAINV
jgi:hypothetical protein